MADQAQHVVSKAAANGSNLGFEDKLWAAADKEIEAHRHIPTPGRYVGAEDIDDDSVPFEEKIDERLVEPYGQMNEAVEPDATIASDLEILGYGE